MATIRGIAPIAGSMMNNTALDKVMATQETMLNNLRPERSDHRPIGTLMIRVTIGGISMTIPLTAESNPMARDR
jgi:hypothetical protein